jgi:hypothetical protein
MLVSQIVVRGCLFLVAAQLYTRTHLAAGR